MAQRIVTKQNPNFLTTVATKKSTFIVFERISYYKENAFHNV